MGKKTLSSLLALVLVGACDQPAPQPRPTVTVTVDAHKQAETLLQEAGYTRVPASGYRGRVSFDKDNVSVVIPAETQAITEIDFYFDQQTVKIRCNPPEVILEIVSYIAQLKAKTSQQLIEEHQCVR